MEQEIRWGDVKGLIRSWKKQAGSLVKAGDVLALVEPSNFQLISPFSGTMMAPLVRNNSSVEPNQVVCKISTCTHTILTIYDICTSCNVMLADTRGYAFYVTPSNHPIKRRVDDVEAELREKKKQLLESKRLVLILDLDQTVLHAVQLLGYTGDMNPEMTPPQQHVYAIELSGPSRFLIKFRPGLKEFLLQAHKLYEIHVYTMASNEYANKIVQLINDEILADVDPILKKNIIGSRIITRCHTEDPTEIILKQRGGQEYAAKLKEKRKDIRHIIGDSSIAVILDDSDTVWPDYPNHLIQLSRYVYWPNQKDLNQTFHANPQNQTTKRPKATTTTTSTSSTSSTSTSTTTSTSSTSSTSTSSTTSSTSSTSSSSTNTKKRKFDTVDQTNDINVTTNDNNTGNTNNFQLDLHGSEPSLKKPKRSEKEQDEETMPTDYIDQSSTRVSDEKHALFDFSSSGEDSPSVKSEDSDPEHSKISLIDVTASDISTSSDSTSITVPGESVPAAYDNSLIINAPSDVNNSSSTDTSSDVGSNGSIVNKDSKKEDIVADQITKQALVQPANLQQPSDTIVTLQPFGVPFSPIEESDTVLASMERVLTSVHSAFFELPEWSNRRQIQDILPRIKARILQGRAICYSRIFPKSSGSLSNQSAESFRIKYISNLLASFGASYVPELSPGNPEGVTHLVASHPMTRKVEIASVTEKIFCVRKEWIDESVKHWRCENEAEYRLGNIPSYFKSPPVFEAKPLWTREEIERDEENHLKESKSPQRDVLSKENHERDAGDEREETDDSGSDVGIDFESILMQHADSGNMSDLSDQEEE